MIPSMIKIMRSSSSHRLVEVDALRGLAAMAVVLFHYTTRFNELFQTGSSPTISFPDGHYGVNLFFIISGFVIFMTLEKTVKPMDFVVSRFSRLFPAYWVAIFLTFSICHLLGLPGRLVGAGTALANMVMLHGLLRVPHVDGVYWTLEVELLFYCGMFLLYRLKRLRQVHHVLFGLLVLRLVYYVLEQQFGISLPWIISRLLILQYIPWFALGISIYLAKKDAGAGAWRRPAQTGAMAIVTLLVCESAFVAALAVGLATAVFLGANERLSVLRFWPFVWLGTVSYPLYLLHENIGWAIQLRLRSIGMSMDLAILVTLCASLLLAGALTRWVEQPAMRQIRNRYKDRGKTSVISMRIGIGLGAALLAAAAFWLSGMRYAADSAGLHTKIEKIVQIDNGQLIPCAPIAALHPFVILALGQSNAANDGIRAPEAGAPLLLIADGKCMMAVDPLPGSTGDGGSIWSRLPRHLRTPEAQRPLALSVMGVDATSMQDWTGDKSPLRERLIQHLKSMQAMSLSPDLVLWQQGEADARLGTTSKAYSDGLDKLAGILNQAGSSGSIIMARSTVCRSLPNVAIRAAIEAKAAGDPRFKLGPDTDTLVGTGLRRDGCHFSTAGLDDAARQWAAAISGLTSRP